jgi:hypothetical protein
VGSHSRKRLFVPEMTGFGENQVIPFPIFLPPSARAAIHAFLDFGGRLDTGDLTFQGSVFGLYDTAGALQAGAASAPAVKEPIQR